MTFELPRYFPKIEQEEVGKTYTQAATEALKAYENLTKDKTCFRIPETLKTLASTWEKGNTLVFKTVAASGSPMQELITELNKKIKECVDARKWRVDVARVWTVLDNAIKYLTLPTDFDKNTLIYLGRAGLSIDKPKKRIASIFGPMQKSKTSWRDKLIEKRDKIKICHDEIEANYKLLKQALEPLARHCDTTSSSFEAGFNRITAIAGSAPYVDKLVHAAFAKLQIQNEEKTSQCLEKKSKREEKKSKREEKKSHAA